MTTKIDQVVWKEIARQIHRQTCRRLRWLLLRIRGLVLFPGSTAISSTKLIYGIDFFFYNIH